jgi:PilZ domain-containing protein
MRERREVPRYIYGIQGKVTETATGGTVAVTVEVLSTRGCATKGGTLPPLGQVCELQLDWHGREIRLPSTVAWKSKDGRVGLKFGAIPDEQVKLLRGLCASLQLQPLVPTPPEPHSGH